MRRLSQTIRSTHSRTSAIAGESLAKPKSVGPLQQIAAGPQYAGRFATTSVDIVAGHRWQQSAAFLPRAFVAVRGVCRAFRGTADQRTPSVCSNPARIAAARVHHHAVLNSAENLNHADLGAQACHITSPRGLVAMSGHAPDAPPPSPRRPSPRSHVRRLRQPLRRVRERTFPRLEPRRLPVSAKDHGLKDAVPSRQRARSAPATSRHRPEQFYTDLFLHFARYAGPRFKLHEDRSPAVQNK